MQNNLGINFNIQEKDYIQLFSNMPSLKIQKYKSVFTIVIINIVLYFLIMFYAKSLDFSSGQFAIASLVALAVLGTLTTIFLFNFRRKHKKMIFDISKEKYQELRGDVVNLTLDKDLNIITINNRNIPFIEEDTLIINTPKNYFIYFGKKIYSNKVLIPKRGDDKYKNNVNELIDYLSKFKNVKIIESNK